MRTASLNSCSGVNPNLDIRKLVIMEKLDYDSDAAMLTGSIEWWVFGYGRQYFVNYLRGLATMQTHGERKFLAV